jgi:glycosyltransferase involved in cell wall biosynthesis
MQLMPCFPNITGANIVQGITEKNSAMTIQYSIIIPVFNRPDELGELLESLRNIRRQADATGAGETAAVREWEVIVVEDGSTVRSDKICEKYSGEIELSYIFQENAGPAAARNTGSKNARGEWLVFFDSDCIIPPGYFEAVNEALEDPSIDFFGGPDRAAADFTNTQKAIDYAMTSFLTTGGIRGGRRKLDTYYPRSFNMGIRRSAFEDVSGFTGLRFGEDLDLSMRLMKAGYRSALVEDAWVYHKRRTNLKKFFKQVYNSGMARVVLNRLHPGTMKTVHLLPSLFVLYLAAAVFSLFFISFGILWYPVGILAVILFIDGFRSTGGISAALMVPPAGFVQLCGYGTGLLHSFVLIHILGRNRASAFEKNFYK